MDDDVLQFSEDLSVLMVSWRGCWIVPIVDVRMPHITLPQGFFQRRAAFGRKWRIFEETRTVRVEGD